MDFSKIKIAFFDMDGTLYSSNTSRVSEKTIFALKQLQANGVKICVATGRPKQFLDKLMPFLDQIGFDYYISNNGQAIFDKNHQVIYKNYLNPIDVKAIIKKANELQLCYEVIGEDYHGIVNTNDFARQSYEYLKVDTPVCSVIDEDFNRPVENLVIFESTKYIQYFKPIIKHSVITYWTTETFDFVPDNGVKVNGMKKIMEHLKIQPNEVIAFGDGQNDMDMLTYAGFGVAMGNASLEVKEIADYVGEHIDNEGVYETLKLIGLI